MAGITIHSTNLENLVVGELNVKWSARGDRILRYYIDVRHKHLNVHKEVSAPEIFILQSKMDALMASWDDKFEHLTKKNNIVAGHAAAEEMTADAIHKLDGLDTILQYTLNVDDRINWEELKDKSQYNYPKSFPDSKPTSRPEVKPVYSEPKIGFFDVVFGRKSSLLAAAEQSHQATISDWEVREKQRASNHANAIVAWEASRATFWADHSAKREQFEVEQAASHAEVDRLKTEVAQGNEDAVIEHASLVLEASDYRGLFEKSYLIQYNSEQKLIKLAYDLPAPDALPSVRQVKFVKVTGELRESHISERDKKNNFEKVCYQICLRTLHEIFEADEFNNIEKILFNGFVNFVDPAKGVEQRVCILSVLVGKQIFSAIDLARVEPKVCFKSLKGVSAASLSTLVAIPPVMEMDTEDRRFIEAREVGSTINSETNLASISWEDFEHLVRELFEREFESRGGEVKVTQSSSDGGVDAVAFDPDPITGGKIVIQAKRYTRTVGVSAVRDLYGTVMNEGASRGILVTTADYGPDAYSFANGKPITLMNGANLLHMMERHGQKAKIDLREARELANNKG
ncbi:restriction system protein [Porphyrobacter sp. MBR-155]|jgi:restriction system protein|uniref:restriction endonuclease n=1 Tax=Porphyrobacter sp. MBR-155 TaxID=3156464 RepID=UPI00339403D7